MGRGPSPFKKQDVKRALLAAAAAGIKVRSYEIYPITGKIVVLAGKPEEEEPDEDSGGNEWDRI